MNQVDMDNLSYIDIPHTEQQKTHSIWHSTSKIITYFFHPILIPTYTYILFSNISIFRWLLMPTINLYITVTLFTITALIPILLFYLMKRMKLINSFKMETRQERIYPLILLTMIYLTIYFYTRSFPIFFVASIILFSAAITSLVALCTTLFIKVSLHTIGLSSFIAITLMISIFYGVDFIIPITISIIIAGIVGTSRLILNAHTPQEVYLGYYLGIIAIAITLPFIS